MLVLAIFYLPGLASTRPSPQTLSEQLPLFFALAAAQIALLLVIITVRGAPARRFGLRPVRARSAVVGIVAASLLGALLLGFDALARLLPASIAGKIAPESSWAWNAPFLLIVPFAAATGYREELLFRAYLLTRLGDLGVPPVPSVFASALLFALGHLYQGPLAVAFALVQAAGFGWLFLRLRDLHALAIGHALYNLGVLILVTVGTSA